MQPRKKRNEAVSRFDGRGVPHLHCPGRRAPTNGGSLPRGKDKRLLELFRAPRATRGDRYRQFTPNGARLISRGPEGTVKAQSRRTHHIAPPGHVRVENAPRCAAVPKVKPPLSPMGDIGGNLTIPQRGVAQRWARACAAAACGHFFIPSASSEKCRIAAP